MLIKQISVFIENMPGKLGEVTQVLGENGIDMSASPWRTPPDLGSPSHCQRPGQGLSSAPKPRFHCKAE